MLGAAAALMPDRGSAPREHTAFKAFAVAALCTACIWFVSPYITSQGEPWDGSPGIYAVALIVAGLLNGALVRRPFWVMYVGAVSGQLLAMLLLGRVGPLLPIGFVLLLFYTLLFLAGAFFGAAMRRSLS